MISLVGYIPHFLKILWQHHVPHLEGEAVLPVGLGQAPQVHQQAQQGAKYHGWLVSFEEHVGLQNIYIFFLHLFNLKQNSKRI